MSFAGDELQLDVRKLLHQRGHEGRERGLDRRQTGAQCHDTALGRFEAGYRLQEILMALALL
ncbi:hypothetical protein D3C81_1123020 [compost metagenome]